MTDSRYVKTALGVGLVLLFIVVIILSLVPPVSRDAMIHHLAVPKLYLKNGGMYELPHMPFSYYPMNLQLLYLIPLYFGNDIAPKFIHFSFALLTAWLIFKYLHYRSNKVLALFGALFFLSIPIILKLSITVYVDLGLIFFSTASLLLILMWVEKDFPLRFLVLSAVCCGLAMGTKYNGLVTFVILSLFVPFLYSRYVRGDIHLFFRAIGYGVAFALIALVVFSPWMIRNYLWTNNPIFPLYDYWFNSQQVANRNSIGIFSFRAWVYKEAWWEIMLLPVRIFFQGKDGNPQYFDGVLNPFLMLLPILAFWRKEFEPAGVQRDKNILLAFSVLFLLFAFFTVDFRIRYVSPIIPPLVILSVFGLQNGIELFSRIRNKTIYRVGYLFLLLVPSIALGLNALYILSQFKYVRPLSYIKGELSHEEYVSKFWPEYGALQFINRHLPKDALVLFVFLGKRGYYSDREYIIGNNLLKRVFVDSDNPREIYSKLVSRGITHLLICHPYFDKWIHNNLSGNKHRIVKEFFKEYVITLFYGKGFGVWQLNTALSSAIEERRQ